MDNNESDFIEFTFTFFGTSLTIGDKTIVSGLAPKPNNEPSKVVLKFDKLTRNLSRMIVDRVYGCASVDFALTVDDVEKAKELTIEKTKTASTNKMFKIIGIDAITTGDVFLFKDEEDIKNNGHKMFSKERPWESVLKAADKNSRIIDLLDERIKKRHLGKGNDDIAFKIKAIIQE